MALELKSSVFKNGEFIPDMYTCKGEDSSPPLSWSEVPDGTKSFALICDDPDAPMGTWVHWVIYDVPGEVRNFPSGIETKERLSDGTKQGINDSRRTGYHGPCPPPGKAHRYFFKLYALDTLLELESGLSKDELLQKMKGHILGEAQIMGKFSR